MRHRTQVLLFIILFAANSYADQCIKSIDSQLIYKDQTQVKIKIDLDNYVDTFNLNLKPEEVLRSIERRAINCDVNELYSQSASKLSATLKYVPVWGTVSDNIGWVIYLSNFVNDNLSESINGLALSLVTFNLDGQLVGVLPLSTFSQYEGVGEKSSAIVDDDIITICLQDVDFFAYDEKINLTQLLETPKKSECQYEYYKINKGIIKRLTQNW